MKEGAEGDEDESGDEGEDEEDMERDQTKGMCTTWKLSDGKIPRTKQF